MSQTFQNAGTIRNDETILIYTINLHVNTKSIIVCRLEIYMYMWMCNSKSHNGIRGEPCIVTNNNSNTCTLNVTIQDKS